MPPPKKLPKRSKYEIKSGVKAPATPFSRYAATGFYDLNGKRYRDIHALIDAGYKYFWEKRNMKPPPIMISHQFFQSSD